MKTKFDIQMKNTKRIFVIFLLLILQVNVLAQNTQLLKDADTWAEKLMISEMLRFPDPTKLDFAKKSHWNYTNGLLLKASLALYNKTGQKAYYDYAYSYLDQMINQDGTINTYDIRKYNLDMLNSGKVLLDIYQQTKEERFLLALHLLRSQLVNHPRTSDGGFWHKKRYTHQMWLDGLYMGHPFYAQYATVFEDEATAKSSLEDIILQFDLVTQHHKDPVTGLWYHGWDESKTQKWANPETGTSPHFWLRSIGWYSMALVDVLDFIPEDFEGRDRIIQNLNDLANTIVKYQDKTGLWYQVVDMPDEAGNYLESSGTSMFTYTLAKAVRMGYIPKKYMKNARKAYKGLLKLMIEKDQEGLYNLNQNCAVAGLGGNPYRDGSFTYYVNEPIRANDPKGTGPFILASLELNR